MHVAIIGTGNVGSQLGAGLVAADHAVTFGSRDPEARSVRELVADLGDAAAATTIEEAVSAGEAVVTALPPDVAIELAAEHAMALAGRPVLDPTNRYPEGAGRPVAAEIAAAAPEARVVKVFNTIGAERLRDPVVDGRPASMFVAGDDAPAKDLALDLAGDLGFAPVDAGGLDRAERLESLARLWIDLSQGYGREIGFALLGA